MVQIPGSNILAPVEKKDKDEVGYRNHEKCVMCAYFGNNRQCDKVYGKISPDGICSLFDIREDSGPYNKEFFQKTKADSDGE